MSSPVLLMMVSVSGAITSTRPRNSLAAPTPPARATIILTPVSLPLFYWSTAHYMQNVPILDALWAPRKTFLTLRHQGTMTVSDERDPSDCYINAGGAYGTAHCWD